jgi:hypothetical protein
MTRTLIATTLVLLTGAIVTGAIYFGFLNTPESTVWTLGLSAVLAVASLVVFAFTIGTVLLVWSGEPLSRRLIARASRGLPACVPPLLLVALVWWVLGRSTGWFFAQSGEVSAWFIARFGWSDVSWLFSGVSWVSLWLRWAVAPFVAFVWWRSILVHGWRPTRALLHEALRPSGLLITTVALVVLVYVPWTYLLEWRPRGLTPGTIDLAFAGAKLGLVFVLSAVAVSLVARAAATEATAAAPPGSPAPSNG